MRKFLLILSLAFSTFVARAVEFPLVIDREHSRVEVDVHATAHSFAAKLTTYEASIFVDSASKRITRAHVHFHFNDIKTGKEKRDTEMNEWQNTTQFPDGVFTLSSLDRASDGKWTAKGALLLHGVSRDLSFPVVVDSTNPQRFIVSGETPLDVRDFGLPVIKKFLLKVDPVVKVRFHLQGTLAAK
jgi:polyisoprenoid-binding protein YceI